MSTRRPLSESRTRTHGLSTRPSQVLTTSYERGGGFGDFVAAKALAPGCYLELRAQQRRLLRELRPDAVRGTTSAGNTINSETLGQLADHPKHSQSTFWNTRARALVWCSLSSAYSAVEGFGQNELGGSAFIEVPLVDSWNIPDFLLNSCLGRYDGRVYEALWESTRFEPLNKTDIHEGCAAGWARG